ncbi:MAG: transcriptional regulator, partial [Chloroflexota bacterium]
MKFIVSVVNKDDVLPLVEALVANGYGVTTFKTAGGFLRKE